MERLIFKNLDKSELVARIAVERMDAVAMRFPDLGRNDYRVTLSMDNSPQQAGRDFFSVRFHAMAGRYKGVILEVTDPNLYAAMATLTERLQERLNRFGDKARVLDRNRKRLMRKFEPVEPLCEV